MFYVSRLVYVHAKFVKNDKWGMAKTLRIRAIAWKVRFCGGLLDQSRWVINLPAFISDAQF